MRWGFRGPYGKVVSVNTGNFIGGVWRSAAAGRTFTRTNPADYRDQIGAFADSTADDVRAATAAARVALPAWKALAPDARAQFLFKAADLLASRRDEVAAALTREEGKTLTEATGETMRGVMLLRYFAGEGLRIGGDVIPSVNPQSLFFTERVPLGVVGLITPWNFPVAIPLWKAAPALVYGNTVVLKPSELAPGTAALLAEILAEAGFPDGVFNIVQGGRDAGAALSADPAIDAISFTGSAATGKAVAVACVERGAKYQLEMGGKNPVIVLADADLDRAVELTVQGAMRSAGEKCTATSRAIVVEAVADVFTEKLVARVRSLSLGPGIENAYLGPVITAAAQEKILAAIQRAKDDGARLLCGGGVPDDPALAHGHYVQPTVFADVRPDSTLAQEEIFGPVLGILTAQNLEQALTLANGVAYGLSASLFTRDIAAALRFIRTIEAGLVRINGETAGVEPQAPFGGMKGSSSYSREQGQAAREFFTQLKTVSIEG